MRSRAQRLFIGILLLIPVAATAFSHTLHHVKIASPSQTDDLPVAMEHIQSQIVRRSDDFEQIKTCRRTCLRVCGHEHSAPYEYSNCYQEALENWMP
ncbi:hypothetical protein MAPG_01461 [Magnaporthiopsis poae ATCC 64411]|uniref:Uncharacterized protein n=1 Tax=Magnaporthiopsis poae (strain ATCC 64411 / 73-15) TaxID=644358 RepID=A0A0C4DNR7_MAGP6|nr:hypothetical protein MAPG_01461 [Magnaporthiopsis poae ATCC 64411]